MRCRERASRRKGLWGQAPRAEPVPVNPNKIVKTCPVCFRAIAVMGDGTMAHHGFERPGHGFQTESCPGIRFKPLEVSTDGLVWYISVLEERIAKNKKAVARLPKVTSINNPRYRPGSKLPATFEKAETESAVWDRHIEMLKVNYENAIDSLTGDKKYREKIVKNWKPGRGTGEF